MSKLDSLKQLVNTWKNLDSQIISLEELFVLLENEPDENLNKELEENLKKLDFEIKKLEIQTKLSGKHDRNNAIVAIHGHKC